MAKVTLGDLSQPLKKIEEWSEKQATSLEVITEVVSTGISVQGAILEELKLQTVILQKQAKGGGGGALSKMFGGGKESKGGKMGKVGVLKELGAGTMDLAKGLLVFMLVPSKTVKKFLFFINGFFEAMEKLDAKEAEKGKLVLSGMGEIIYTFAKNLAKAAILLIPGMIAIPFLIVTTVVLFGYFMLLGMGEKQVTRGTRALDKMGDAIRSFAIGLAFFAVTTFFILMQPMILVMMMASIALMTGAFYLIGKLKKDIVKGSVAMLTMGLALIPFAIGYGIFAVMMAIAAPTWEDLGKQAAILVGTGLIFALAGSQLALIAQGALGFAAIGLGMIVFSIGYLPFALATKGTTWNDVGIQMALLFGLGVVMSLMGLVVGASFGLVLLGPLMYAAIGLSLLLLAPGLIAFKTIDWKDKDTENLTTMLGGLRLAFMGGQKGDGFFAGIGNVFKTIVSAPVIAGAAAAYGMIGLTLTTLSKGLADFADTDWDEDDTKNLTEVLSGLSSAFASAGGEPTNPGGLWGAVFGTTFTPNAVERGAESIMDAGSALIEISKGLERFHQLSKKVKWGTPEKGEDGDYGGKDTMAYAVINTIGFVQKAFAAVGNEGNVEGGGFWAQTFGYKRNAVAEGIHAVQGAGAELFQIAEGLEKFASMSKTVKWGSISLGAKKNYGGTDTMAYAVINTLAFVRKAFAAIGGDKNVEGGGFWAKTFNFKRNVVAEGISAVSGAGAELFQIAEGLEKFASMAGNVKWGSVEDGPKKFYGGKDTMAYAVINSLAFVRKAFAAVGGEKNVQGGGFWATAFNIKRNKVAEGVHAVQGAGEQLDKVADSLTKFQALIKEKVIFGPATDKNSLAYAVSQTLTFVGSAFSSIGSKKNEEKDSWWIFEWDESTIQKGIEAVHGAGDELEQIAKGISAFVGIKNPAKVASAISMLINSTAAVFKTASKTTGKSWIDAMQVYSDYITVITDAAKGNKLGKAATQMGKLADNINKLEMEKMEGLGALMTTFTVASAEIDTSFLADISTGVGALTDKISEYWGPSESEVVEATEDAAGGEDNVMKKMREELRNLNQSLRNMNGVLDGLPSNIENIELKAKVVIE
jgi:hypothetical protein